VIFCNHILEHVDDDRRAMREMYRVMRPGGWGITLSPVNTERETTYEDPSITDPAERERHFGAERPFARLRPRLRPASLRGRLRLTRRSTTCAVCRPRRSSCTGCAARSSMSPASVPNARSTQQTVRDPKHREMKDQRYGRKKDSAACCAGEYRVFRVRSLLRLAVRSVEMVRYES